MGWVDVEKEKAANVAAIKDGLSSALDPIYYTDGYPREGCSLEVNVEASVCGIHVRAPGGRPLESYLPPRGEVGRYVQEWLDGIAPRVKPSDRLQGLPSPDKAG